MKITIKGTMDGLNEHTRANRGNRYSGNKAKKRNQLMVYEALLPDNMPTERYMPICLAMLEASDAVYMLDGWETSRGVAIERRYAEYQNKRLIYQRTQSADCSWK